MAKGRDAPHLSAETLKALSKPLGDDLGRFLLQRDVRATLVTQVRWSAEIPRSERLPMVERAMVAVRASHGPWDNDRLGEAIRREISLYRERPIHRYQVATPLSLPAARLDRPFIRTCRECRIRVAKTWPSHIERGRRSMASHLPTDHSEPLGASRALIEVQARSPGEAVERGMDALDFMRGVWAYAHLRDRQVLSRVGRFLPDNPWRDGPEHTVHRPDGSIASDDYWYDPQFREQSHQAAVAHDRWLQVVVPLERKVRQRISSSKYRPELELAFIRYARAADTPHPETAFLRWFQLLEMLTGVRASDGGEVLVRRITAIYTDPDFVRDFARHLVEQRNRQVHRDEADDLHDTLTQQARQFVDRLILHHLSWCRRIPSIAAMGRFLDLPADPAELRRTAEILTQRQLFQKAGTRAAALQSAP